ncbi:hypothetical protein CPC08DRAFT_722205 [Agrocybe pediades]|nr:hypothetical protein CPC08DRAFT_722205 [Agrocybe pediades]
MAPRRKSKKNARVGASTSKKRASGGSPVPPARSSTPVPPSTVAATPATVVVENTEETRLISLPLLNTSPNLPARFRKTKYLLSPWIPGTPLPERSGTIYNRRASLEETHNLPMEDSASSTPSTSPIASTPQVSGPSIGPSGVEDNSESPNQGPLSTMVNGTAFGPPERNEAHDDFNPSEETISAQVPGGSPQGDVSSDPLISPLVSTNAANLSCPCPGHPGPSPIYCYACRTWSEAYEGGI